MLSFRASFLIISVCISTFAQDTLSVGAYNVEALFNLEANQTDFREYSMESWNITSYRTKVRNIASIIAYMDVDILALSEIEDETVLTYLIRQTKKAGSTYPYFAIAPQGPKQGITVGIISKYPIVGSESLPVLLPNHTSSRAILMANILIDSDTITFFANHWPSKRSPESYRIIAAEVVKKSVEKLPQTRSIIIAGDLNSSYDEATQFITSSCGKQDCDDTQGRTGINHILSTWQSSPGSKPHQGFQNTAVNTFYNPWQEASTFSHFSYIYKGEALMIDHTLFSHHFFIKDSPFTYLENSFMSITKDGQLLRKGTPFRWQIVKGDTPRHLNRGYSDHLPVVAKFIHKKNMPSDFHFDDTAEKSFGVARDGWRGTSAKVTCQRTMSESQEGVTALQLSGSTKKNNTVAKLSYVQTSYEAPLEFYLKGHGRIGFRMRSNRQKSWSYFSVDGSRAKSANYQNLSTNTWQKLSFTVQEVQGDTLEFELRSKGGEKLHLLIDNVSHNGGTR